MLRVVNMCAGYGKLTVTKSVSLSVKENEVVALVGGNGAGKSTLLRSIAGLVRVSEGRVLLSGANIASWPAEKIARAGLALVPESRALFPAMTIHENLKVGTYASRPSRSEIACRFDMVHELFPDLKKRAASRAGELSGGQQQMLALGRALMSAPRILLLDEPSTGLAPVLVAELFEKIGSLKKQGMTILIAEQNVHKALDIADRGYVIENGRIILEDTGEALKSSERIQKAYLGV
ncbi:MAG: ABC transporter ATP-binding protein [Armatimonadota bacterium]|nr:ABC transporter ATP-binding protein [bacterium]